MSPILDRFLEKPFYQSELERLEVREKLEQARAHLAELQNPSSPGQEQTGTIGTDPSLVNSFVRSTSEQLENAST